MTRPCLRINFKFSTVHRCVEINLIENVNGVGSVIYSLIVHPHPASRTVLVRYLKSRDALKPISSAIMSRHDGNAVDPPGFVGLHLVPLANAIIFRRPCVAVQSAGVVICVRSHIMWRFGIGVSAVSSVTGTRPSALWRVQQVTYTVTTDEFGSHRHVSVPRLWINSELAPKHGGVEIRNDAYIGVDPSTVPRVHFSTVGVRPSSCSVLVIHFVCRDSLGIDIADS